MGIDTPGEPESTASLTEASFKSRVHDILTLRLFRDFFRGVFLPKILGALTDTDQGLDKSSPLLRNVTTGYTLF